MGLNQIRVLRTPRCMPMLISVSVLPLDVREHEEN